MNKFFIIIAAFSISFGLFAAAPRLSSRDAEAAKAYMATATEWKKKVYCDVVINLSTKEYKTFSELKDMVFSSTTKYSPSNQLTIVNKFATNVTKIVCQEFPQFRADAFAFAKQSPSPFDVAMYVEWDAGLSVEDLYKELYNSLVLHWEKCPSQLVKRAVNKLVYLGASSAKITTQKQDLQRLNRIFSPLVLNDKTTWEPICSVIRTAIDTY